MIGTQGHSIRPQMCVALIRCIAWLGLPMLIKENKETRSPVEPAADH